ncbi:MAG: cupredoxin family copper-binding protein [Betaproteobacteria bacterium]|nr:cupredoxin family copper-binding protein [Betaproteobacteria bacterium]MDE2122600.1 cupredoxin family copper-binding protein [Betaproteobacteria bacterium]MDE2324060.1 cupredoxin family copper-binding protein [Betaproteobacteria bacterium]
MQATKLMAFVLAACLPVAAWAASVQVTIQGMDFHPSTLTVAPGTTVTWTNEDSFSHATTSDTKVWDSGLLAPHQSFSTTLEKPGTYPYHCAIHSFMTGAVVVK